MWHLVGSSRSFGRSDGMGSARGTDAEGRCLVIRILCVWCITAIAVSGCSSQGPALQDAQGSDTATQAPEMDRVDVSALGPQVGDQVPEFSLTDQTGTTRTLESVMGPNGVMLVFHRSADW